MVAIDEKNQDIWRKKIISHDVIIIDKTEKIKICTIIVNRVDKKIKTLLNDVIFEEDVSLYIR